MKCPDCGHVQRATSGRICSSCTYVYRLDQKTFPFVGDRRVLRAVEQVGGGGTRAFTADQVVTRLLRSGSIRLGWRRRTRTNQHALAITKIGSFLDASQPEGYLGQPAFESLTAATWPEPDIHDYGAERIPVVDRRLAVDLLVRLWVHTNAKAIIVAVDSYPREVAARVNDLIARRPDLPVFVFHGTATDGATMIARTRERFRIGDDQPIRDLGLRPDFAATSRRHRWARKLQAVGVEALPHAVLEKALVNALLADTALDDRRRDQSDGGGGPDDWMAGDRDDDDDDRLAGWMDDGDDFG